MENKKLVITKKGHKGDDGYKIFSIRIPEGLVSQLEIVAGETGRSRNEIITILLEFGIRNCVVDTTTESYLIDLPE